MSKLKAHQFSEQFFKERGELMSGLAKDVNINDLKEAYCRGVEHGSEGYYRGEVGIEEGAAYDLGWDAGNLIRDPDELEKKVIERIRQIHGVFS